MSKDLVNLTYTSGLWTVEFKGETVYGSTRKGVAKHVAESLRSALKARLLAVNKYDIKCIVNVAVENYKEEPIMKDVEVSVPARPEYPSQGMLFKDFIAKCRVPNDEKTLKMWEKAQDTLTEAIAMQPFNNSWLTYTDCMPYLEASLYLEELRKLCSDPSVKFDIMQDDVGHCIKVKVESK